MKSFSITIQGVGKKSPIRIDCQYNAYELLSDFFMRITEKRLKFHGM